MFIKKIIALAISFFLILACFAQQAAIEQGKEWIDLDYVGDGIIGHKLDIHLPKNGNGPFPVIFAFMGVRFFPIHQKALCLKKVSDRLY